MRSQCHVILIILFYLVFRVTTFLFKRQQLFVTFNISYLIALQFFRYFAGIILEDLFVLSLFKPYRSRTTLDYTKGE